MHQAGNSAEVTDATAMANISTLTFVERHPLSGGAIFGIVVAVLLGVCGLAGETFKFEIVQEQISWRQDPYAHH